MQWPCRQPLKHTHTLARAHAHSHTYLALSGVNHTGTKGFRRSWAWDEADVRTGFIEEEMGERRFQKKSFHGEENCCGEKEGKSQDLGKD